jgi:hypothetical protein
MVNRESDHLESWGQSLVGAQRTRAPKPLMNEIPALAPRHLPAGRHRSRGLSSFDSHLATLTSHLKKAPLVVHSLLADSPNLSVEAILELKRSAAERHGK